MSNEDFIRAVTLFYDDIKRVAFARLRNVHDAEDITQNVFLKLHKCKKAFQDEEVLKKWLVKVTVNECRSFWRHPWNNKVILDIPETISDQKEEDSDKELVFEAILSLKSSYRLVIHLFYFDNYSAKDIAEIL